MVFFCCESICLFYVGGFCFLIPFALCFFFFFSPAFRSWPEVKLTHEQQRILNHKIEHGQIVKIMAFAGKSQKLYCKNKRITSNFAPSRPAPSVEELCGCQGALTLLLINTKNQSKLLQRNRNGKHGGGYTIGHDTETECLGTVDGCPERPVGNRGEEKRLSVCCLAACSTCYCRQAARQSRSYLFRFSIPVEQHKPRNLQHLRAVLKRGSA